MLYYYYFQPHHVGYFDELVMFGVMLTPGRPLPRLNARGYLGLAFYSKGYYGLPGTSCIGYICLLWPVGGLT